MEFDFTTPDQKTAQQMGIRWVPDEATPEQVKWWSDRALTFVVIASLLQFGTLGFMLFNFWVIYIMTK